MLRRPPALLLLVLAACGGGGGTVATLPVADATRLAADSVEIAANATETDLVVQLAQLPSTAPSLLQVALELPPQLTLAAANRLQGLASVPTRDGDFVGDRFLIVCGDARNADAATLVAGPLFRVRIATTNPRTPGSYSLRLTDLRAASRDGNGQVPLTTTPVECTVVVR